MTVRKAAEARVGHPKKAGPNTRALVVHRGLVRDPLRPLRGDGLAAWTRLHEDAGWLTAADLDVAQVFCEMVDERVVILGEIELADPATSTGARARNVLRSALRRVDEMLLKYARDLGVAPAYRAQLGMRDKPEPVSEIERLRAKYPVT